MVRMLLLVTTGYVSLRKVSGRVYTHGCVFPLLTTASDLGTEIYAKHITEVPYIMCDLCWPGRLTFSPQSRAEQFLIVTMDADAVAHKARQVIIHGCLIVWPSVYTRHSQSNTPISDFSQSYGSHPCGEVGNRIGGRKERVNSGAEWLEL